MNTTTIPFSLPEPPSILPIHNSVQDFEISITNTLGTLKFNFQEK